jgi:streptomycin 6-kinase
MVGLGAPSVPARVLAAAQSSEQGRAWLAALPARVEELERRWGLSFEGACAGAAATCSFVAFVRTSDRTAAALKIGMPHLEAEQELDGLRFWDGEPTVRLLAADAEASALLLERCEPGTPLSERHEAEQDEVIAGLLRRLWRVPPKRAFRPLELMLRYWVDCALARESDWPDAGFARAGIALLQELGRPAAGDVLLATDLHAGNVLRAERQPWLVIDPKPFLGDAAYDATQHLLNCLPRVCADPTGTVTRLAERLEVSSERVRHWLWARLAAHTHVRTETFGLSATAALELGRRLEKG